MPKEFHLDSVVPWGRSAEEYTAFFSLDGLSSTARILDCASGPSSFAAEMSQRGFRVTAVDPLYRFARGEIEGRIAAARDIMSAGVSRARHRFVWSFFTSEDHLIRYRMQTMQRFLDDYEVGLRSGRYVADELPELSFADGAFDVVLCSHFLFMYDDQLDAGFHHAAVAEMLRVGREVRLFPLQNVEGEPSAFVPPLVENLRRKHFAVSLERVAYEFQKGGNTMLRVARPG